MSSDYYRIFINDLKAVAICGKICAESNRCGMIYLAEENEVCGFIRYHLGALFVVFTVKNGNVRAVGKSMALFYYLVLKAKFLGKGLCNAVAVVGTFLI